MLLVVGCRYCPIVNNWHPTPLRSFINSITSSSLSPIPTIIPDFAIKPYSLACFNTSKLKPYFALERTWFESLFTVSILCPSISGFASNTISNHSFLASKSGISTSIIVSGFNLLISLIVSAQCSAPLSGKSSLSTEVITQCFKPISLTLLAIFFGSLLSNGNGLPESVAQNLQLLVHISPAIIKVAVPLLQHSPILGHLPLEQIVCR